MQLKAYVVRIWRDESGRIGGHVNEPETDKRLLFRSWRELRQILAGGFDAPGEELSGTHSEEGTHLD